jgi:hypothetical protein
MATSLASADEVRNWPLTGLLLDKDSPRFGIPGKKSDSQEDILDQIIERFGVDDLLSSLAANGYFRAEPMVCRRGPNPDTLMVAEGNRRLAACLILAKDPRASRQARRTEIYRHQWIAAGSPPIDPVPVLIFDEKSEAGSLLAYLGVRHISSSLAWDSYAKAAWVARVVESHDMQLPQIEAIIGDEDRVIQRLLEAYYLMRQLTDAGEFKPEDSIRRGRGSNTDYPFSWVYTILGYSAVRRFLGIDEQNPTVRSPVPAAKLKDAGLVIRALFGDRSKGRNAAVEDSRELSELASIVADPEKLDLLSQGKPVWEILQRTKPFEFRLREGLRLLSQLLAGVTEDLPSGDTKRGS